MEIKGKRVLVYGAGKSGLGAVRLLLDLMANPVLFDENQGLDKEKLFSWFDRDDKLMIVAGELSEDLLGQLDFCVLSPGIPCEKPLVQELRRRNIPVWSEIELAYRASRGTVLAITGTNGKTTTTALLGKIMEDALAEETEGGSGKGSVFVVGNIGTAWTGKAMQTDEASVIVAEISSFQLETIDTFAPKVSAILNITEDHLNRHHTMEEYARVKERIAENQSKEDVIVLNADDPILAEFGEKAVPKVCWFSSRKQLEEGAYLEGDAIVLRMNGVTAEIVKTQELHILGVHNYENAMAAVLMAINAGVGIDSIRRSLKAFTAVPHRIEFVTEKRGVAYYNDSKGTNPDAAIRGIRAMTRPTYLIGGGYDKGSTYDDWIRAFDGKVKKLVLIGQTKEKIRDAAVRCGFSDILLCEDLAQAVAACAKLAQPGDAVLLSPACASWGQFDNYEQRGDIFKELVNRL